MMSDNTVTLDSTGRVVIPKSLRDELHLEAGDKLTAESDGNAVTLRPLRPEPRMRKKHGIWVFCAGEPISTEEINQTIDEMREARTRSLLGSRE
jgi:AbrB family looped-hinge helix DNA binding protein